MDNGADPVDGEANATLSGWSPPDGPGWYLLSAVYDGSGGTYAASETTGDTANELVFVKPSVSVLYNGPWRVNNNTPLSSLQVAAVVLPQVPGCEVEFTVTGGDFPANPSVYTGTTKAFPIPTPDPITTISTAPTTAPTP